MIEVKYFGAIADKTSCQGEEFHSPYPSLQQLLDELEQKYRLSQLSFSVVVNRKIVRHMEACKLEHNDIVALLPPFSGG